MKLLFTVSDQLLHLLAHGDRKAFRKIFDQNAYPLYAIGRDFLKNDELVANYVNEVFSHVWEDRKSFQDPEHFRTYLMEKCKHLIFVHFKRMIRETPPEKVFEWMTNRRKQETRTERKV